MIIYELCNIVRKIIIHFESLPSLNLIKSRSFLKVYIVVSEYVFSHTIKVRQSLDHMHIFCNAPSLKIRSVYKNS